MSAPLRVTGLNTHLLAEKARQLRDQELPRLRDLQAAAERDPARRCEQIRHAAMLGYFLAVYRTCKVHPPSVEAWQSILCQILSLEVGNITMSLQNANMQALQDRTPDSLRIAANWRSDYPCSLEGMARGYRRLAGELQQQRIETPHAQGT